MYLPFKTLKKRNPWAILRKWALQGIVDDNGMVDLSVLVSKANGVSLQDIADGRLKLIKAVEYARKYGIPYSTVMYKFAKGVLRGVKCKNLVFLVDEPPPESGVYFRAIDMDRLIAYMENMVMRATLGRTVALVRLNVMKMTSSSDWMRRQVPFGHWRKQGRLFRYRRHYYILVNMASYSLDEIRRNFQPADIMIPKPTEEVSWDDVVQVK